MELPNAAGARQEARSGGGERGPASSAENLIRAAFTGIDPRPMDPVPETKARMDSGRIAPRLAKTNS
jgi:hypothetical protein